MGRAIEKLADRESPIGCRDVVCHRCGTRCALGAGLRLDETACIGCLRPLAAMRDERRRAVRALAAWWDKASAAGPGYGVVACPHCGTSCVVELGTAARTACIGCLQALGSAPLVRMDLTRTDGDVRIDRPDLHLRVPRWAVHDVGTCLVFPGEAS